MRTFRAWAMVAFFASSVPALAADYPAPKQAEWTARDFRFHTGETLAEMRIAYTTVGEPSGQPVLVLHGTTGSATSMLTPNFAGELFGAGQPLDAGKYYIIIPDGIGHGKSSKPSDGMKAKFPHYNYDDMVAAQHRLLTEGLGVKHVRLIIGNSMGGMHAWLWGVQHPDYMDAIVPMASQPTEMAGRNWIMRRLLVEAIRQDPDYKNGEYSSSPSTLRFASALFNVATNGGTLAYQKLAPTRADADKVAEERFSAPPAPDANNYVYAWDASRDYNPAPGLEKIEAAVLAINSADDERNPSETGVTDRALARVKNAKLLLIPASEATRGHGTTAFAKFYAKELREFLEKVPQRSM